MMWMSSRQRSKRAELDTICPPDPDTNSIERSDFAALGAVVGQHSDRLNWWPGQAPTVSRDCKRPTGRGAMITWLVVWSLDHIVTYSLAAINMIA